MSVERHGVPTIPFWEYAKHYCIITRDNDEESIIEKVKRWNPKFIEIPYFQRKIVWKKADIDDLIDSDSTMFGTIIMAQYATKPFKLIDGLQRLATITTLLFQIYRRVLSDAAPEPEAKEHFKRLGDALKPYFDIISHNDDILKREELNYIIKK